MALDESREEDTHYQAGSMSFILDPSTVQLARSYGTVVIDYVDSLFGRGFTVSMTGVASC
ncbi:MAG: hypothetical protein JRH07_12225 [Deltaproteobacteria bacterium]|nr:hypothetical protein [Deltaproteobacteria bacterium]MBW2122594.1 hypothetical protein [Deltaproteobacteria bacterium]